MKKLTKKGQAITFENAPRLILLFIVIGMTLGAGTIALAAFRGTADVSTTQSRSDTFTALNSTGVDFSPDPNIDTCTNVNLFNGTNVVEVTSEFTISNCRATLFNNTINNTVTTANYTRTFDVATDSSNAINNSIIGAVNLSAQLPTVGTILGVGLILVVVIGVFAFFAIRGAQ